MEQSSTGQTRRNTRHIPVTDPAMRMHLLGRVVAAMDGGDPQVLGGLLAAGITPDVADRLKRMPVADALRFTADHCGLSIELDLDVLRQQLDAVARSHADQRLYETFVRAGASPQLISRLFRVAQQDVRRYRAMLLPQARTGGRPKMPPESVRMCIRQAWIGLQAEAISARQAYLRMHERFPEVSLAAIESVIDGLDAGQCRGTP